MLTVKLGCSRCDLTQNLSTPRYSVVHSEAPTNNLWRVVEEKKLIDICKKSVIIIIAKKIEGSFLLQKFN